MSEAKPRSGFDASQTIPDFAPLNPGYGSWIMQTDLSKIAILNESPHRDRPGDVSVFRNVAALARYIEPIDVLNNEFFAYTVTGRRLDLSVENDQVRVAESEIEQDFSALVRRLLEHHVD